MPQFKTYLPTILVLALILFSAADGKISWFSSVAKNKLVQLRELRDKMVAGSDPSSISTPTTTTSTSTTTTTEDSNLVVQGRDMYGGGGGGGYGGGGGGGGYGMQSMMPSLETSLTTLAFLSFGAFLLSMLLRALNVTTAGRRRRDLEFEDGDIYTFSDAARIALDAVNNLIFDSELPECTARALCKAYRQTEFNEDGLLGQSPWIARTAMKWLTSESDIRYIPPKWRTFQDTLQGTNCDTHYSECSGNDDDLETVGINGELRSSQQTPSRWKAYMTKIRRWNPSDWTLQTS